MTPDREDTGTESPVAGTEPVEPGQHRGWARRHRWLHVLLLITLALTLPAAFFVPFVMRFEDLANAWWAMVAVAAVAILVQAFSFLRLRAYIKRVMAEPAPVPIRMRKIDFDKPWKEGKSQ